MSRRATLPLIGLALVVLSGCGQVAMTTMPVRAAAPVQANYVARPEFLKPLTERLTVNPVQFYMAFGSEPRKVTLGMQLTQTKISFNADLSAGGHGQGWNVVPQARMVKVSGQFDRATNELSFDPGPLSEREIGYFKSAITPWPSKPASQTTAAQAIR